ncbi:hypothetical protein L7F22_046857 [Adiantum nelumboides]|nr:hypothetical protein [Adiantum nelumboides]
MLEVPDLSLVTAVFPLKQDMKVFNQGFEKNTLVISHVCVSRSTYSSSKVLSSNNTLPGYNGRGRGRNIDFKRNFNCYKCGKYGHLAAQHRDPEKRVAPQVKQLKLVPIRAITKSSGVVIEELPEEAPIPSKLNPKAMEWEQQRNTSKEKGKAKEFDE